MATPPSDAPDVPDARPARRAFAAGLAAIVLVALVLRLPSVFEGPALTTRDEMNYVPKAVRFGGGDLNPHYFQNPPLASYLMFAGMAVRYAWGRVAGDYAGPLDFKADFLADGTAAYVAARSVALLIGLATVVHAAFLARALLPRDATARARTWAGLLGALGMALSRLHALRSGAATNETLVTLTFAVAVHASVLLVRAGTTRAAVAAGLLAGLAAASKYTGAVACVAVGAAALLALDRTPRERLRLCAVAAAASVGGFLAACPWAVLDHATWRAHVADLQVQKDRWDDGRGWMRYLDTAWGEGLGPLWSIEALCALGAAAAAAFGGVRERRAVAIVALLGVLPLTAYLFLHTRMAYGRYLMPVYPVVVALAAAHLAARPERFGRVLRPAFAALVLVVAALQHADWPDRVAAVRARDTRREVVAWLRANVPDGAHVVVDWEVPPLPDVEQRREFEGRVSPETWARLVPAFRVTMAFRYFALPVERLRGTDVPVDDLDGLRAHAPVWFVVADDGERSVEAVAVEGDRPPLRWYRAVRDLPVVHREPPRDGVRGPSFRVHVLR